MSKTNKKILKEKHLNTILMESYKQEKTQFDGSPVIASFEINVTTENLENHNGRVYKSEVWNQPNALQKGGKYLDESGKLRPLSLLGNLDHPKDNHSDVYLSEAGLAWSELSKDGDDWIGKAHVLDTPHGRVIKTFLEYAKQFGGGEQIGVSTRALGDAIISESNNGPVEEILPDGFELVSIDFVYNPSSIYSNTPLMESKKRKSTLVESIKTLRDKDLEHKEIYDEVLKDITGVREGIEHMDFNVLLEATKKVEFSHAVVEFIEGGPSSDTPAQAKLRKHKESQTRFTDLDELFDLVYKADQEFNSEKGGYDKCYIDFYGKLDNEEIKLLHIRYDIGDKLKREDYPSNSDLDELEDVLLDKVWRTYKVSQGLTENKFSKQEATSITKAKAEYLKQLKDTEYKLHHAIYTLDNMSDDEYKQTKYYIDTPEKKDFLSKLTKEHEAVLAEIKGIESLSENQDKGVGTVSKENKDVINEQEEKDLKPIVENEDDNDNEDLDDLENDNEDSEDKDNEDDSEDSEDKDNEDDSEDNNDNDEELTVGERLDILTDLVLELSSKFDNLFEPIEPLETLETDESLLPDDDEDLNDFEDEDTDFTEEDIDSMTEEELLSLEELLELE